MKGTELTITTEIDLSAITNSELAESTKTKYEKAISNFLAAGGDIRDPDSIASYARDLPHSSKAFLKSAIRMITQGAELRAKASATPENVNQVQAALYRMEALREAVKVSQPKGEKIHKWLSSAQVKQIMATCGDDIQGKRDWVALGILLGAGLRREEVISVEFKDLTDQPMISNNGKMRTVLNVTGKGAKTRQIPLKPILAEKLKEWRSIVGDGLILRSLGRKKIIGESLSTISLFHLVRKHGKLIGVEPLDPHDLRRTYAEHGFRAGVPLPQLSKLLGHESIETTTRYLNLALDLEVTASDFVPLE